MIILTSPTIPWALINGTGGRCDCLGVFKVGFWIYFGINWELFFPIWKLISSLLFLVSGALCVKLLFPEIKF